VTVGTSRSDGRGVGNGVEESPDSTEHGGG
jgi:hypothetical protein